MFKYKLMAKPGWLVRCQFSVIGGVRQRIVVFQEVADFCRATTLPLTWRNLTVQAMLQSAPT